MVSRANASSEQRPHEYCCANSYAAHDFSEPSLSESIIRLITLKMQHERTKLFRGRLGDAVKARIWIAVRVYVLVAIGKVHLQPILSYRNDSNLSGQLYALLLVGTLNWWS